MNYILKLLFKVFKPSPFNEKEVICHTSEAALKALNNLLETGDISEDTKVAIALVIDFVKRAFNPRLMFVTNNVSDGLLSPFQEKVSKEGNRANPPHLRAAPRFESTIRPEMEFTTFTHYLFSTFLWTPCRPETFSLDSVFTAHPEPPPISTRYARHSLILRSASRLSWLDNLSICIWVPGIQTPSLAFGFTGLIKFVPNYYLSICIWVSGKQRSNHACVYNLCIRVYQFWQWLS